MNTKEITKVPVGVTAERAKEAVRGFDPQAHLVDGVLFAPKKRKTWAFAVSIPNKNGERTEGWKHVSAPLYETKDLAWIAAYYFLTQFCAFPIKL